MSAGRFSATIVTGLLLIAIGVLVFGPAWEFLRFWIWSYSNKVPCAMFGLNYHVLGLNFSTTSQLTAQALLNIGLDIAVLGFALIFLIIVSALTRNGGIS